MHWLMAAALALIALILAPGLSFYFDVTPKVMVLLIAAGVAWTWPRLSWRNPLWLLTGLTALSLAISTHGQLGLWGTSWRRYGAITQMAVLIFALAISTQAHRITTILRIVTAAGALTAVYGIAQYFGFDPILPSAAYRIGEGLWSIVRPPSTLGYVSYFATWLLFVIFLSLAIPGRVSRAITVVAAIAMLLTGTRAAVLGAVVGCVVWWFMRSGKIQWRRPLVATGLAAVAVAAFLLSPAGLQLRSRTRWFVEDPWGGARPLLWRDSLRMALDRPLAGHGPEVFTATFPRYESPALGRAYPDFAHESPHNIFLDAFVAQGIPGLLILVAFCAAGLRATWLARANHPRIAAALAAALAASIVAQQFTVFTIPTAVIFFATIAMALALPRAGAPLGQAAHGSATPALSQQPLTGAPPQLWAKFAQIDLARLRFPLAIPLLIAAAHYAIDDRELVSARRELDAGSIPQRLPQRPPAADLWYSRTLFGIAQKSPNLGVRLTELQQSTAAARRATRTAEDPFNAWYSLAGILAAQNDSAGTEQALRAAIAARPNWFKPHWTLAQLLILQNRLAEARGEAARAADLDGGKHPEVAATLSQLQK
jgi:O-antigen ligase